MSQSHFPHAGTASGWITSNRLAAACLLISIAGCSGPANCTVAGKVSFRGKPLEDGAISFYPAEGTPGTGANMKIAGGEYSMPAGQHIPAGKYQIWVTAVRKTGRKIADPDNPGVFDDEGYQYIPAKYNRATELVAELQPGPNAHDLDLK